MTQPELSQPETLILDRIATPIGEALVVTDETGTLRAFDFGDHADRMARLMRRHYARQPVAGAAPARVREAIDRYFAGEIAQVHGLAWATAGTLFQRSVWRALADIPHDRTVSYGDIARAIGNPTAVRAVGLANGSNPVAIVVPCHRVVGSTGALTGYAGGIDRKRWLLAHEAGERPLPLT